MTDIKKVIPDDLYECLKKWHSRFSKKEKCKDFYEKMRKVINAYDDILVPLNNFKIKR